MDWQQIEQNWTYFKRKIMEKWRSLPDEELDAINGRRDRLEATIRARYGFATDHARKEIDDWARWQSEHPGSLDEKPTPLVRQLNDKGSCA